MVPEAVQKWIDERGFGSIVKTQPVGGGCINHGARLYTSAGQTFFIKTNVHTPPDMFVREAEGLGAIRQVGGPRAPEPYLYGPDFLLLEDLAPAPRRADYWPEFGRRLATLHNYTQPQFGFAHNNYIGSTPQPNPWIADGYTFFAEQRLMFQAKLAVEQGLLGRSVASQVERVARRLPELIPTQPASLIHGDLWSGNAIADEQGRPAMIDPAAYFGWGEAELAMTALFGSFPESFYQAYQEVRPLEKGFRQRFEIYNLYHLLNHVNLFGESYLGEVQSILRRYG